MNKTEFCPDEFFDFCKENFVSPYDGKSDREEILQVSDEIKKQLTAALGTENIPGKTENPDIKIIKSSKRNGYTEHRAAAEIAKGFTQLLYILEPDGKPKGGIVCVCGHGYGVRQILRRSKSGKYRLVNFFDNYQKNFAAELARDGFTVLAFEPVGFGEARLKSDIHKPFYISSCDTVSHHSLLYGFTAAGLRVFQALSCVDILCKRYGFSEVGIAGISGGGLVALYSALCDERIQKACVCGYINSFRTSVLGMWHCPDNYIPGLYKTGDMCDFAAALAPRPLMMQYGERDKLFPFEASREAAENIAKIYRSLGAEDCFIPAPHGGKHEVNLRDMLKFFEV